MDHLVDLPNLRQWQDLRMSHVKLDNFYSREYYWCKSRHAKNSRVDQRYHSRVDATHCCSPYDRQSSRTSFTATTTSYIRVTQNLK